MKPQRLLGIDVGNTHTVIAFWKDPADGPKPSHLWRIRSHREATADECHLLLKSLIREHALEQPPGVILSSVVPSLTDSWLGTLRERGISHHRVSPRSPFSFTLQIEDPSSVGADRLVNAEGAMTRFQPPLILIDCGTATTICAIDKQGAYRGGMILPGFEISSRALTQSAAQLHQVDWESPAGIIGHDTRSALQSGLSFGSALFIDSVIEAFRKELQAPQAVSVGTGGVLSRIAPLCKNLDHVIPELTAEGLWHLAKGLDHWEGSSP